MFAKCRSSIGERPKIDRRTVEANYISSYCKKRRNKYVSNFSTNENNTANISDSEFWDSAADSEMRIRAISDDAKVSGNVYKDR